MPILAPSRLVASASPGNTFVDERFMKQRAPTELVIEDKDIEMFEQSIDAVSGEGNVIRDQNAVPNNQ
jgi:hypothetical protein